MNSFKSNKNKFIAIVIVGMLFIPISWNLAIKKTWDAKKQLKELNEKLKNFDDTPERMATVENRIGYLNQLLVNNEDQELFQDHVLDEISSICKTKGLLLKAMPPMFRNIDNNYMVETINVQVSGAFHDLLYLVYLLEKPDKNMNVISTHYFIEENKRMKQKQLIVSIYIQTLKERTL